MNLYRKTSPAGKALPNWYCFFRVPDQSGNLRQVHRSTGKRTKKEALEAARLLEETALAEAGADTQQAQAILGKLTEAGELAMKGRLNPAKAREILTEIMKAGGAGEFKSYTLREWIQTWLEAKEATVSKATLSFYRTVTSKFLTFLGERADAPLESITTAEVRDFRTTINAKSTAKTANHYVVGLRALFTDAMSEHATLHNPTSPLKGKSLAENDSTARHPFTLKEVSALLRESPSLDWEGVILLGAYAGLRLRDAANLTSDNLEVGKIRLTPEKTKAQSKTIEIPLHSELSAYFAKNPPSPFPGTPLFPSLCNKYTGGRTGLSAQFNAIMEASETPSLVTRGGRKGTLSFHSLRHSFVSWMSNAEVSPELRKKLSGHSTDAAHTAYTSLEFQTLADAVAKLPRTSNK